MDDHREQEKPAQHDVAVSQRDQPELGARVEIQAREELQPPLESEKGHHPGWQHDGPDDNSSGPQRDERCAP